MKKAISLFLALSVLCFATSAMAAIGNSSVTGSKNNVTTMPTDRNSASMPGFRPGDKITFNVTEVTKDKELTLISYKMGSEANLSDSNVQYINQYTLTGASQSVSYNISSSAVEIF